MMSDWQSLWSIASDRPLADPERLSRSARLETTSTRPSLREPRASNWLTHLSNSLLVGLTRSAWLGSASTGNVRRQIVAARRGVKQERDRSFNLLSSFDRGKCWSSASAILPVYEEAQNGGIRDIEDETGRKRRRVESHLVINVTGKPTAEGHA